MLTTYGGMTAQAMNGVDNQAFEMPEGGPQYPDID